MMKKYACNRLYRASDEWMPQSVVTINERGEVERIAPLLEETSATEWLGGIIILSDKKIMPSQLKFNDLLDYLTPVEMPLYAWHISDFDFQQEEMTSRSVIRRL
jgi:hypothetical protein